jgi:hypothetical protein
MRLCTQTRACVVFISLQVILHRNRIVVLYVIRDSFGTGATLPALRSQSQNSHALSTVLHEKGYASPSPVVSNRRSRRVDWWVG